MTERIRTAMELNQILNNASKRISTGLLKNEAQVKQAVIIPILRGLDWDDTNPTEFVPEFSVDNGLVDYALCRTTDNPLVFIEAKRLDGTDDKGVAQLFRYANNRGVPLLILTDGNIWEFYLSMAEGLPADRRFYRMDLRREDNFSEYVKFLESHLQRPHVLSGQARREAERRHENNLEREKARNVIPIVWMTLLQKPDDMLRDVLTEAVESECGTKPDLDDIEEFLKQLPHSHIPQTPNQQSGRRPTIASIQPKNNKIVGYILNGRSIETGAGYRTLAEILKEFQLLDAGFMIRFASKTAGRTRQLVAENPDDLYQKIHLKDDHSLDLGNGWWLGTNLSRTAIHNFIKIACEVAGVRFGMQLKLIER